MPKKYRSEGLDAKPERVRRFLKDPNLLDLRDRMTVAKPGDDGRTATKDESGRFSPEHDDVMIPPKTSSANQGNSRQYALRKLRDDAQEIHARVLAGELSTNAGMVLAGFRPCTAPKPRILTGPFPL